MLCLFACNIIKLMNTDNKKLNQDKSDDDEPNESDED